MPQVPQFFDSHIHLRQPPLLPVLVKHLGNQCCGLLAMPNTTPPIVTGPDAVAYGNQIQAAGFTGAIITTIRLVPTTTPATIVEAHQCGVRAGKLYPDGVTTNSQGGIQNFQDLDPIYAEMQDRGMHLLIHGERPGFSALEAEQRFLSELMRISHTFPRLKITLEHITTVDAVNAITNLPDNVSATITLHHLLITIDDVIGATLHPHNFCKPVAKQAHHRQALLQAAFSGNPKFRFGSDSAPHPRGKKECASGCAGVYTAPIMMPLLYETFEQHNRVELLPDFTSGFASDWFDVAVDPRIITLIADPWVIPAEYDGIVPFMAGRRIKYRVVQ